MPPETLKPNQTLWIILKIAAIIGLGEWVVMWLLFSTGHRIGLGEALLGAGVLMLITIPLIYLWVVSPFVRCRQRAIEKISYMAFHDPLTRLPNRRLLSEHIDNAIASALRHRHLGALIYFDLDGFKPINDTYGHKAGDEILCAIGQRLRDMSRAEDIACRVVGGDEFVLLLPHAGTRVHEAKQNLLQVASKIREQVNQPILTQAKSLQVGCSIGICLIGEPEQSAAFVLHDADIAMYQAKRLQSAEPIFADEMGLTWYRMAEVGFAPIDEDHAQIDRLLSRVLLDDGERVQRLETVIAEIIDHFGREEQWAQEAALHMDARHRHEHARLRQELREIHTRLSSANAIDCYEHILELLRQHIRHFDAAMVEHRPAPTQPAPGISAELYPR